MELLLLLSAILFAVHAKTIPNYVQVCRTSTPNYEECVTKSVDALRPYLTKGIPKMLVPPLEPLHIPTLTVVRDTEALKVQATLNDMKIHGATNFQLQRVKVDTSGLSAEVEVNVPQVHVTTDYNVDGRLLGIGMKGSGVFTGNFTGCQATVSGKGRVIDVSGTKYAQVDVLKIRVNFTDSSLQIRNTDGRNAQAAETLSNFISQNQRQVFEIILPVVEDTAEAVVTQFLDRIFRKIPLEEMLPK